MFTIGLAGFGPTSVLPGALVGAVAVGGLAFGAIRGRRRDWADPIAFLASTVAFHLAMGVAGTLLTGGALVNALDPGSEAVRAVEHAAAGE